MGVNWCKKQYIDLSRDPNEIERLHSRGQHTCKFIGTKESICMRKECNFHKIGLVHQHDRRFIALEHQTLCRDVMRKRSINARGKRIYIFITKINERFSFTFSQGFLTQMNAMLDWGEGANSQGKLSLNDT